jgi:hypothetical protein
VLGCPACFAGDGAENVVCLGIGGNLPAPPVQHAALLIVQPGPPGADGFAEGVALRIQHVSGGDVWQRVLQPSADKYALLSFIEDASVEG